MLAGQDLDGRNVRVNVSFAPLPLIVSSYDSPPIALQMAQSRQRERSPGFGGGGGGRGGYGGGYGGERSGGVRHSSSH